MLKKLLKYEIRATARLFLPVFGAILLLAILNNIFFANCNNKLDTPW